MPLCDARRRSDKPGDVRLWLSACARMRQNDGAIRPPRTTASDHRIMRIVMSCLIRFALAAVLAMLASAAPAQPYPTRPIRLLVSFPPGGASDLVARTLGQPLGARLGQPVVVENRPGSNGNLAGDLAAHATPDGYTLLLGPSSLFAINPHLSAKMAIDPLKDLLPVASLVSNELILAANPALPSVADFGAFIALARGARPPLFYASIGNGSEHHLAMELLKQQAGIDLVHVPYRGGGPAAIGVMAGDVAAMFGGGSVAPLIQGGQAQGVSGQRSAPLAAAARLAAHRRRLSRLRNHDLAGSVRAGRHAAGDRGAAARGGECDPRAAGHRGQARRRRIRRSLRHHACGFRRAHPERSRALRQADQGHRPRGGLAARCVCVASDSARAALASPPPLAGEG